ncbi:AMP-binding protein [Cognatiyoonia sp. IB215446]|uniref:AMP-binding protein n=1 Tax=Cognatiyoonia sp. IB215446 TaxID=3097355 RepID=UPI002A0D91FD|nr:AMP-binding protein [Cognatiyoonia sp. IB215446]MDX8348481.1 AMP-binding protein [Cognatiyoonia sp. IB215446]
MAQGHLINKGVVGSNVAVARYRTAMTIPELDELLIDEAGLGFDSLSRLDLVSKVSTFFNLHKTGIDDYLLIYRTLGEWVKCISHHFELSGRSATFSFQTSGSTGDPKLINHESTELQSEVESILSGEVVSLERPSHILTLVPPHHIYGFIFSCLLPSTVDLDVIDLHYKPITSVLRYASMGDVIVATPFHWNEFARLSQEQLAGVHGVTAAGPSSLETWSVIEKMDLASLTEVFGATETGGIGYRKSVYDDFELLPHLVRDGSHVRRLTSERSYLNLQDRLDWTAKRTFQCRGRLDKVVQIAGVNVSLAYISGKISDVVGVKQAHVRLCDGRIVAFVVPQSATTEPQHLQEAIRSRINSDLEPVARPSEIILVAEPRMNSMGKLSSWRNELCAD